MDVLPEAYTTIPSSSDSELVRQYLQVIIYILEFVSTCFFSVSLSEFYF